jgi:hypothetical protein
MNRIMNACPHIMGLMPWMSKPNFTSYPNFQ